ncbi:MAG: YceI family protein [Leptonema sp. (in: bacteria)]
MNKIKIEYLPDNKIIETEGELSILQISLKNKIPHTHVCFGEAQCSTCRVEILEGLENLFPRNPQELALAKKKGWDERIRLACQTIPKGNLKLRRLILDEYDSQIAQEESSKYLQGVFDEVVVLFLDIQNFTKFVHLELAYNVTFTLNRYFNLIGDVVLLNDGYIDKFIGDSLMAIFGIGKEKPVIEFCLDGVYSAIKILEVTKEFNHYLKTNFDHEFFVRIGLAYGKAVLGNIGHRKKSQYTAIGNVVNLASRLENANKKTNTEILISDSLYQLLKNKILVGKKFHLKLKGFSNVQIAYELKDLLPEARQSRDQKFNEFNQSSKKLIINSTNKNESSLDKVRFLEIPKNLIPLEIDKQHSQITFKVRHLSIEITGLVKDFDAEFYLDPENFLDSKVKVIIPVKQITTFIEARDQHLYSSDFFDVENFPNVIFVSTEMVLKDQNEYLLYGNLFLRGITKKIALGLKKSEKMDPYGNHRLCFTGNTIVNREDFGMHYNILLNENEFVIGKEIKIFFEFECIKK